MGDTYGGNMNSVPGDKIEVFTPVMYTGGGKLGKTNCGDEAVGITIDEAGSQTVKSVIQLRGDQILDIKTYSGCWPGRPEKSAADLASEALTKHVVSMKGTSEILKQRDQKRKEAKRHAKDSH